MSNTNTPLATVSNLGSWSFADNPLFKKFYYATFNTDGTIAEILNPNDLTLTKSGATSSIRTKNTMLVIPTLYTKGQTGKFSISDNPANGTAWAHTFGGHIYDNLAISVYNGYVKNGSLRSISGVLPTKSIKRPTFRTYAENNGTGWMQWNYYAWRLMWMLTTLIGKSTSSQAKLAYGGHGYSSNTTGLTDKLGPFAGSLSSGSAMKIFIEDWWCSQYNFIDDFYGNGGTYYAGQNLVPTDDTANKMAVITGLTSGWWYGSSIFQGDQNFGISSAEGGSTSTGLCDGQYGSTSSATLGCVGGYSDDGLDAGPSCFIGRYGLSGSLSALGARLAFAFDN